MTLTKDIFLGYHMTHISYGDDYISYHIIAFAHVVVGERIAIESVCMHFCQSVCPRQFLGIHFSDLIQI